jgi:transcriptional regulator with XRE-family HTH domain
LEASEKKADARNHSAELRKEAGKWLRELRVAVGISQRALAERVNMEYYTFISQIESGRGRIPSENIRDWAIALEVDPKEFAINLMRYYDPRTYELVFGDERE